MSSILIATHNPGKFKEISSQLEPLGYSCTSPADLNIHEDVEETEDRFEANALLKARFYFNRAKIPTIADDSGILVSALKDELGVKTRRWGAGPEASDDVWLRFFLDRMSGETDRKACFVCAIAYVDDNESQVFLGESWGQLTHAPMTTLEPGIPLSSVFLPENHDRVYSALSLEEKQAISHRGRAVSKLVEHLKLLY